MVLFELTQLMFMLHGAAPMMQVMIIDAYVEKHVNYVAMQGGPVGLDLSTGFKFGDCTDKALLKCEIMAMYNITCYPVHGWVYTGKRYERHDWYEFEIGNNTYSMERQAPIGKGIWFSDYWQARGFTW